MSIVKCAVLSPWFKIVAGSFLFLAAGVDIIEGIVSDLKDTSVGVQHGAFVFAIFHLLGSIAEMAYETRDIAETVNK
tara:strand:+ start:298 stop:528 length:231 start_codon:yes stop_codon:yes gene_type:complete